MDISQLYALEMMRKRRLSGGTVDLGYSTDGLILHLDAIQNLRNGAHSTNTTVWHDLSANRGDVNLYGHIWGDDYCAFTGQSGSYGYGPNSITLEGNGTLEIVCVNNAGPTGYGVIGWVKTGFPNNRLGALFGPESNMRRIIILGTDGLDNSSIKRRHISCNKTRRLFNGVFDNVTAVIPTGTTASGLYLATSEQQFSVEPSPGNMYNTQICAVRAYNRNLSDAEMLANMAIDIQRFSLA